MLENQSADHMLELIEKHSLFEKLELPSLPEYAKDLNQAKEFFLSLIKELIISTDMKFHFTLQSELSKIIDRQNSLLESERVTKQVNKPGLSDGYGRKLSLTVKDSQGDPMITHLDLALEEKLSVCKILLHSAGLS